MFKVGDKVVRRGSIHYVSKSFSLWEVVSVLQTTIPCIEAAPLTRNGKIVHARVGVYAQQQFDHATPEEIAAGHRIDCEILDHPEDYTSPLCKKFDERVNSNETK